MVGFAPTTSGPPDRRADCLRYIPKAVLNTMRNWREEIAELNPDALFIGDPGDTSFDEAIVGIGQRCGQPALIVYDADKIVEVREAGNDRRRGSGIRVVQHLRSLARPEHADHHAMKGLPTNKSPLAPLAPLLPVGYRRGLQAQRSPGGKMAVRTGFAPVAFR